MFENLRRDAARYAAHGNWLTHPGFWIGAVYRLGNWSRAQRNPLVKWPGWALYRILRLPGAILYNVDLWAGPKGARIGPGLHLIHPRNVVIGSGVEIGTDCLIHHEVTLGTGPVPGLPKIGDGVTLYVGARVLGGITVGDGASIGANCVVVRDVKPGSVVLPAQHAVIPKALATSIRRKDNSGP